MIAKCATDSSRLSSLSSSWSILQSQATRFSFSSKPILSLLAATILVALHISRRSSPSSVGKASNFGSHSLWVCSELFSGLLDSQSSLPTFWGRSDTDLSRQLLRKSTGSFTTGTLPTRTTGKLSWVWGRYSLLSFRSSSLPKEPWCRLWCYSFSSFSRSSSI